MINYMLNAGLVRDGQITPKGDSIKLQLTVAPTQICIVNFKLTLAENDKSQIDIISILSLQSQPIIRIQLRNANQIHLQIEKQEFLFDNINIQLYKCTSFMFIIANQELQLIFNGVVQVQAIAEQFTFQSNKVNIVLGSKTPENSMTGVVGAFNLHFLDNEQIKLLIDREIKQQKKSINEIHDIDQIKYRVPYTKPLHNLNQLINWQPTHEREILAIQKLRNIKRKRLQQVIVCHDMAGGYKEDMWSYGNPQQSNAYRFHYMLHCDIFVYFTHTLVSIPTVPYINICHQFGTRILGTIITEGDDNKVTMEIFNQEYADKLIQICQYYKFDGYLLNFETNLDSPNKMIQFIEYMKLKLAEFGAVVIYYDSHTKLGQLKWQSELNEQNMEYFNASEYMFTDYHWNLDKLNNTAIQAGQRKDKVFVGIDVWGRGQYGGGQENTYLALQAIKKQEMSVAIFGQAWTYERAQNSKNQFLQKDQALWQGKNIINLFDKKKNNWIIEKNGGSGWQFIEENDETISIASFDWCIRSFTVNLLEITQVKEGTIQFSVKVKGTGPQFNDPYLLGIELYDKYNQCQTSIDSKNNNLTIKIKHCCHQYSQ